MTDPTTSTVLPAGVTLRAATERDIAEMMEIVIWGAVAVLVGPALAGIML